jgi:hypothetical protein
MTLPPAVKELLSPEAVRTRCREILRSVRAKESPWFTVDDSRLSKVATFVAAETRHQYPTGVIPYHSRWGHLTPPPKVVAPDMKRAVLEALSHIAPIERLKRQIDFIVISVLLDAGAGPSWHFEGIDTPTAKTYRVGRSEGLAYATAHAFLNGAFSSDPRDPLRVDAARLSHLGVAELGEVFQVGAHNPLTGLEGRTDLMNRLGRQMLGWGVSDPRPSALFDDLCAFPGDVDAGELLERLLIGLHGLWKDRLSLEGWGLGDTWRHPAVKRSDATTGLIPFHKLSQWLTYSLLEPFEWFGSTIRAVERLTGLAEYRNGGLLVDGGVIIPASDAAKESLFHSPLTPGHEAVVEWRALTVALLEELHPLVAEALSTPTRRVSIEDFPLAKLLQGGTWSAGRVLARAARSEGGPPFTIASDGTVF